MCEDINNQLESPSETTTSTKKNYQSEQIWQENNNSTIYLERCTITVILYGIKVHYGDDCAVRLEIERFQSPTPIHAAQLMC